MRFVVHAAEHTLHTISHRQSTGNHVRITNRFHFVHIVAFDTLIENFIDRVQECNHLREYEN